MEIAGYLINRKDGLHGTRGMGFDYVLAGNGLFVEATSPLISGRVLVAETDVRGLPEMKSELTIPGGKIPKYIWDLALSTIMATPEKEVFLCVVYEQEPMYFVNRELGHYQLRVPPQEGSGASVKYERQDHVVLDLHSHGTMKAFFSSRDNKDEQGFRLYGVVGRDLETGLYQVRLRLGIYGYFEEIPWDWVFDGSLDTTEVEDLVWPSEPEVKCRVCGCTEKKPCLTGEEDEATCHWVEPDLCSVNHLLERIMYKLDSTRFFDARPMYNIGVVGCGGTGGFVADGLCRMLGKNMRLYLLDHDRVEEHNLRRQMFYQEDLGRFKSQVLAERLARQYGQEVAYSIKPYSAFSGFLYSNILIGCVDNAAARSQMASHSGWWIDSGNGQHSGQVLVGNANRLQSLKGAFIADKEICHALPAPSIQMPELLIPRPEELAPRDCAERVTAGEQSPVINQMMAALTLEMVRRLLDGTLTWMGVTVDLELGTLHPIPIDPNTVARMTGLTVHYLVMKPAETVRERVHV